MSKLVQLSNGDWVAPDRISSIQVMGFEDGIVAYSVVVRTKDGARMVICPKTDDAFDPTAAESLRDGLIKGLMDCGNTMELVHAGSK